MKYYYKNHLLIIICFIILAFICIFINKNKSNINENTQINNEEEITVIEIETMSRQYLKINNFITNDPSIEAEIETTIIIEETETTTEEKTKNETKNNRWNIKLTDYEFEILSQIVMLECGGESDRGQQAVIEVIFNRVYSDLFPSTLEEVLSQKGQFVTWSYRNSANVTDTVKKNIKKVLKGKTNVLPFKTMYFSTFPQNSRIQEQIGGHYFCNQY